MDLDSIIDRLLEVRGSRPGKQVQLLEGEIRYLCTKAREIFISQPILLELEAPIKVCIGIYYSKYKSLRLTNIFHRFVVIYTDSITTCSAFSNTAVSLPKQITSSWATMSIEGNNPWKRSASFSPTRSSIPRISSSCEETTSVLRSTVSTGFMMNARGGTTSSCGRPSRTASTVYQLRRLSMRRSSLCMVV